ncbi:MAG: hypothetical protein ABJJ44_08725 [Paraglaciecola sp.]|uniref:hypothetical protein n=1 Tax=Paraglaciecola sp. TaxID=1920173 RepID=UPI0032983A42
MKFTYVAMIIGIVSAGSVFADSCDKSTKTCSPSSPFDVTNINFVSSATSSYADSSTFDDPFDCRVADYCFGEEVYISGQLKSLMQGMAKYAEEYDDWFTAMEWYNDFLYVKDKNENLSDNISYAIVSKSSRVKIQAEGSSTTYTYYPGQIITGADWNNNGLIDSLEVSGEFYYENNILDI